MLLFGHLGATLGAARVLEVLTNSSNKNGIKMPVDYRLVMLGSMLPDLIDKPLVLMISDKPVGSARFIAHSLIFAVLLLFLGELYDLIFKRGWLLLIACASFAHIIEDVIWRTPMVLFWPYYNWTLGYVNESKPVMSSGYIENRVRIITTSVSKLDWGEILQKPSVFLPEIIGVIVILYFFIRLIKNGRLSYFIRTGRIKF
jgi:inner membrane protein